MKLLFDNNLSVRLPRILEEVFPSSNHVFELDLHRASDRQIFLFARENKYTIVTKDRDFYHLLNSLGAPPKIVWLTLGNCTTEILKNVLIRHSGSISEFIAGNKSLLVIDH